MREIGYENVRVGLSGAPEIGVTADLNPGKPGKCIVLRSDIDALPVGVASLAAVAYEFLNQGK